MLSKEKLLETIKDLPEPISVDDLIDRIMLLQKIDKGLEQSKGNQVFSSKESKEKLKKWQK